MKRTIAFAVLASILLLSLDTETASAQNSPFDNNPFFSRNDPSKYWENANPHGGAGVGRGMELTPRSEFKSGFLFLHRGFWSPGSGIGEHVHRGMEEMYIALTGYGNFTINGQTATIPSVGMALCPMGGSHGIYNDGPQPVQFLNWAVAAPNSEYSAVNFNTKDDLVDAELESPPTFTWAVLNTELLHPIEHFHGGAGTVYTRDVWTPEDFRTNWHHLSHYRIPPGSSIGLHSNDTMEEVYYILSGSGRGTVNDATYDIIAGDAVSCTLHNAIGVYNNSDVDLEIIAVGVSMEKGVAVSVTLGDDLSGR
ncbi:cupin domain-containing protein [Candidatus Latescibacterota bacterium]